MTICEEGEEEHVKVTILNTHGGLTLGDNLVLVIKEQHLLEWRKPRFSRVNIKLSFSYSPHALDSDFFRWICAPRDPRVYIKEYCYFVIFFFSFHN